jgi:phospholipase C
VIKKLMPQIENVVFLMLENRSLDNLLGWSYTGIQPDHVFPATSPRSFDGLVPNNRGNPAYTWDGSVQWYPVRPVPSGLGSSQDRVPAYDPTEELASSSWNGVLNQIFGNQNRITGLPSSNTPAGMLGFLQDYYAEYMIDWEGLDILWTYLPGQLRVINSLALQYAVSDRWFCSVPSQTNPNRAYSLCGTSLGRESNLRLDAEEQFQTNTIFNVLSGAGKSWGLYFTDIWQQNQSYTQYTFPWINKVLSNGEIGSIQQFQHRAAAGTLPAFTYLEPKWGYGKGSLFVQGTDYHPPTHVLPGDHFLGQIYTAVRNSPQWKQTLFIVTFDEHGGTYDHVGSHWGAINPDGLKGKSGFDFNLFGVRVPTLLISPFIRNSTVFRAPEGSRFPFDHTSFLNTLVQWAGVDPVSANLCKRVPAAPSFDGVLASQHVNDTRLVFSADPPSTPPPTVTGAPAIAGPGHPLNALFESVPARATRAIIARSHTLEQILVQIAAYRADPARFEAGLAGQ